MFLQIRRDKFDGGNIKMLGISTFKTFNLLYRLFNIKMFIFRIFYSFFLLNEGMCFIYIFKLTLFNHITPIKINT